MNTHKIKKYLQSFVAIPMLAIATPLAGVSPLPSQAVVVSQSTTAPEATVITTLKADDTAERAAKIDAYLKSYNSPLVGYGKKFVEEADKNDIDWRLLVAIAGQESTFGIHACKKATNSFLGYGSCKINFKSADEAIERVSASLGGNLPSTVRHYGGDKTTLQILKKYNTVMPGYQSQVIRLMKKIDPSEVS